MSYFDSIADEDLLDIELDARKIKKKRKLKAICDDCVDELKEPKVTCFRCGREGHIKPNCYAKTRLDGTKLPSKTESAYNQLSQAQKDAFHYKKGEFTTDRDKYERWKKRINKN